MAMFSLAAAAAIARKSSFLSRLKTLLTFQNFNHTIAEGEIDLSKWSKLDARKLGIKHSMIPQSPWIVVQILQSAGFEAYFVGGCVRDLLLNRVPKDFDVITTAALAQVRKKFHRSLIVGRRFPICQVTIKGCVVEVSSFETVAQPKKGKDNFPISEMPKGCDVKDLVRWRNCMHRDFTVNSLFFDPFANKIYDYVNALSDITLSKLRTLIPAQLSFDADCARILRGLRLAARLGLSFSEETESAIHILSSSILSLDKSRIMMELNYMLSYGAAEPSLSLLQRFHLLEILLPAQAAHLTQLTCKKSGLNPLMLMKLFSNVDQLFSCDRPADCCLWVAVFAFHLALISNPQHALVVLTFASTLYHGKWKEGVKFARRHADKVQIYIPEISDCSDSISDEELAEKVTELAVQVQKSVGILTEADTLLEEMEKFPGFQCPGLVFVPKKWGASAKNIFDVLVRDLTSLKTKRGSLEINYESIKKGNVREARFVLGKIIMHTLGCELVPGSEVIKEEKHESLPLDPRESAEVLAGNGRVVVDQSKCHSSIKTYKKRTTNFAEEQVVVKKQKFNGKNICSFEQGRAKNETATVNTHPMDIAEKKQDLIEDNSCLEVANNHQKMIGEGIGYASKMREMADSNQLSRDEIRSMLKYEVSNHEVSMKEQKAVDDKEYRQNAEQHLKLLEKVNDDISWEQQKPEAKCLSQQESDIALQNVVVEYIKSHAHQNKRALEKGVIHKRDKVKIKGRPRKLSSLFRKR